MTTRRFCLLSLLGIATALVVAVPQSLGANFVLAPDESYLTISGVTTPRYRELPVVPQFPQSLTASLAGSLNISQWTTSTMRINDGWINPLKHAQLSQPVGLNAAFSGQVDNFSGGYPGYFLIQDGYTPLWGVLPASSTPGRYRSDQTTLGFGTQMMIGVIAPSITAYGDVIDQSFKNISTEEISLSEVNGRHRIEIPVATQSFGAMQGYLDLSFSGKIVAYSDDNPRTTSGVRSGRFEMNDGWTIEGASSRILPSYGLNVWGPEAQEWGKARLVFRESAKLHQMILGPDMLLPDTKYEVTFDISNAYVENNTGPDGDLDALASVEAYLALGGTDRAEDYAVAGGLYRLDRLSDIEDGTWQRGQSFVLDTRFLTPEQLRQSVYLVFRGSTTRSAAVEFDNVSINVVPEPTTLNLCLPAILAATAWRLRSRRTHQPSLRISSPRTTNARACG